MFCNNRNQYICSSYRIKISSSSPSQKGYIWKESIFAARDWGEGWRWANGSEWKIYRMLICQTLCGNAWSTPCSLHSALTWQQQHRNTTIWTAAKVTSTNWFTSTTETTTWFKFLICRIWKCFRIQQCKCHSLFWMNKTSFAGSV